MLDLRADTSVETIDLQSGEVELKGTTASGKGYTLSADVSQVRIVNEREVEYHNSWVYTSSPALVGEEYWLKFRVKEDTGAVYTVQVDTVDVERTARIRANDRTAKAIEAARVLAGAPESAKFRFDQRFGEEYGGVDEPTPVDVLFRWTEKVVK